MYDAWNRLEQVKLNDGSTDTEILEQEFNGLHWRTVVRRDTDLPVDGIDQMRVLSYDASWRLVEEMVDDNWTTGFTADRTLEQFWGLRYIDDPILRRTDPEAVGGYWHVTDVQFSTMALLDNNAAVYERVWYTPYGEARHHWGQDYNGDRGFSTADGDALIAYLLLHGSSTPIDDDDYVVEMDSNRDGAITFDDYPSGSGQTAVAVGQISDLDATSGPDNWFGYAGYVWEGASSLYHVKFRTYSPSLGRWMQRDPLGYVDGMSLYAYSFSGPLVWQDPFGLTGEDDGVKPKGWPYSKDYGPWRYYEDEYGNVRKQRHIYESIYPFGLGGMAYIGTQDVEAPGMEAADLRGCGCDGAEASVVEVIQAKQEADHELLDTAQEKLKEEATGMAVGAGTAAILPIAGRVTREVVEEMLEAGELAITSARRLARGGATQEHHLIPQELRKYLASRGVDIDVDDYCVVISQELHDALHAGYPGQGENANWWNVVFRRAVEGAEAVTGKLDEGTVLDVMREMQRMFGLEDLEYVRYHRAK